MLKKKWFQWLVVFLALPLIGAGVAALLLAQGARIAGWTIAAVFAAATLLWLFRGIIQGRAYRWIRLAGWIIATGLLIALLFAGLWHWGWNSAAIAISGIWGMTVGIYLGLGLLRLVLAPGHPITGVARTVLDEALRMRIVRAMLIVILLTLPVMPLLLRSEEQLQFRLQTFLSLSLLLVSVVLSLLTIFLACWTISSEVQDHRIFMTLSKPVARWQYLLGKFVGIALLNLLLLAIAGGSIYIFARMIQQGPAHDQADRVAAAQQVLSAREVFLPQPSASMDIEKDKANRLKQLRADFPDDYPAGKEPTPAQLQAIDNMVRGQWHTILPGRDQVYVFKGLDPHAPPGSINLRLKVEPGEDTRDQSTRLSFRINGHMLIAPTETYGFSVAWYSTLEIPVPVELINPDGTAEIAILNGVAADPAASGHTSVHFAPGEGLKVLAKVGAFEPNLLRALTLIWIKLLFMAMLGLAAGSFLSFPVACVVGLAIYMVANLLGMIAESLPYFVAFTGDTSTGLPWAFAAFKAIFAKLGAGDPWEAFKVVTTMMAAAVTNIAPDTGSFNPVAAITDGLVIPGRLVLSALLRVTVLWTGVLAAVAWLAFRRRELARVTV